MLIVCLVKGVPAKTTSVVTVSGVLRREEMDLVLNPHDGKAIEAAHYVKQTVGGKTIGVCMGPEPKIMPVMKDLAQPVEESFYVPRISFTGFDERVILSDRRMAGADTWATSYTLACGIKKIVENHLEAVDKLVEVVKKNDVDLVRETAEKLYRENLLPNYIFSKLPTVKDTLVNRFSQGRLSVEGFILELEKYRREVNKFIILTGMKTSDGETGNTGPQTAEALSSMLGTLIPSIAFVRDFEVSPDSGNVIAVRKVGSVLQKLRTTFPCLLTIDSHYEPRVPAANLQKNARLKNYAGRVAEVRVWNAEYIKADPSKLGLMGSPTIVGPGYEVGKPPTQKFVDETLVFKRDVEKFQHNGKTYGPFSKGDLASSLPEDLLNKFKHEGVVGIFSLDDLVEEIFGGLRIVARAV
ncbi:MAG: hypothetical protein QW269_00845 [Candidatus Caldarchaeum sp.]